MTASRSDVEIVREALQAAEADMWGNPSSLQKPALEALAALEARLAEAERERDAAWGIDRDHHLHGEPRWSMLEIERWLRALGFTEAQVDQVAALERTQ